MAKGRPDETPEERADRNWNDLLQELRVSQTGVQVLGGFLVTLPFQDRFADLDAFQHAWYVALLSLAFATVSVLLAPVAVHRHVFQQDVKPELVRVAHVLMSVALGMVGLLLGGILFLIVDVLYDRTAAAGSAVGSVLVLVGLLGVLPRWVMRR